MVTQVVVKSNVTQLERPGTTTELNEVDSGSVQVNGSDPVALGSNVTELVLERKQLTIEEQSATVCVTGTGPQGVPGTVAGSVLIHTQSTPSDQWIITHNLGRIPLVNIYNAAGCSVIANVVFVDANTIHIESVVPFSGSAIIV